MTPQEQYIAQLQQNAQQFQAPQPGAAPGGPPMDPALAALIQGNPGAAPQQFAQPQYQQPMQQQPAPQYQAQPQYQQQPAPQYQAPPQQLGVDPQLQGQLQQAQQQAAVAPPQPVAPEVAPKKTRKSKKAAEAEASDDDDSDDVMARSNVIVACISHSVFDANVIRGYLALLGG